MYAGDAVRYFFQRNLVEGNRPSSFRLVKVTWGCTNDARETCARPSTTSRTAKSLAHHCHHQRLFTLMLGGATLLNGGAAPCCRPALGGCDHHVRLVRRR